MKVKENDILVCRKDYIHKYYGRGKIKDKIILFKKGEKYKISTLNNFSYWYDPGKYQRHQYVRNYHVWVETNGLISGTFSFISERYSRNYRSEDYIWDYFYPLSYWRKMKLKKLNESR